MIRRIETGFMKLLSSLHYLLRQGLAIQGYKECDGNLTQLLKLQTEDDLDFKFLERFYGLSAI